MSPERKWTKLLTGLAADQSQTQPRTAFVRSSPDFGGAVAVPALDGLELETDRGSDWDLVCNNELVDAVSQL
jgi:hypothetical protein